MQTSCPECRTTFRVTQEQLGLRRGLVRCGTCNAVFNAYDTLLPELAEPPRIAVDAAAIPRSPPAQAARDETPPPPEPHEDAREGLLSALHGVTAPGVSAPGASASAQASSMRADAALTGYLQAADMTAAASAEATLDDPGPDILTLSPSVTPARETSEAILLADLPHRAQDETSETRPRSHWKTALYLTLSALLLAALGVQWAYFLRGNLAAAWPESRPWLEMLCQPWACQVPLPEQLTRQAIVSSSLENDPEQKSRVRLSFLLANRTAQTQAWPHVVLTLIDVREAPVAQKAFSPEIYLPKPPGLRTGFPAHSEQEARVDLDIGSLAAASYVLNVVYP